jgi:hypothetical protein
MTVYVLIREDQNEHGYVDTSIVGVYHAEHIVRQQQLLERRRAKEDGLIVEDDDSPDGDWQVSWAIEEHVVS